MQGGNATARTRVPVTPATTTAREWWVEAGTSWHTVIAWGQLAENAAASKGDRVIVAAATAEQSREMIKEPVAVVWPLRPATTTTRTTAAAAAATGTPF